MRRWRKADKKPPKENTRVLATGGQFVEICELRGGKWYDDNYKAIDDHYIKKWKPLPKVYRK